MIGMGDNLPQPLACSGTDRSLAGRRRRSATALRRLGARESQFFDHPLAHNELLHLPGDRHRHLCDEAHVAWNLIVRNLVMAEGADLLRGSLLPGLRMIHAQTSSPYFGSGTPNT